MALHDLALIRKRWVSILLITTFLVAGALTGTLLATPTYEAKSQVFVSLGSTPALLQDSNFTQYRVTSYTNLVTGPLVLIPVIERLGLHSTPDELAKSITADSPLNTVLINVTVSDQDPQVASEIANATVESLATEVAEIEKPTGTQPSPVRVITTRAATVPTAPATPNTAINLALGLLVGLGLGYGQALLREALDTKVR